MGRFLYMIFHFFLSFFLSSDRFEAVGAIRSSGYGPIDRKTGRSSSSSSDGCLFFCGHGARGLGVFTYGRSLWHWQYLFFLFFIFLFFSTLMCLPTYRMINVHRIAGVTVAVAVCSGGGKPPCSSNTPSESSCIAARRFTNP